MTIANLIVAFSLAGIPWLAGIRLTRWLVPNESRIAIIIGAGSGLGIGLFLMTLMIALRFLPPEIAIIATYIIFLILAIWAIIELPRNNLIWDISHSWTILGLAVLGIVATGAAINFSAGVWNGATHENLVVRMAMTAHMAAGDWPPEDPYAPGTERLYRYTAQAWGASLIRISGIGLFEAVLAITTTSTIALFVTIFATLASLRTYFVGLLSAIGFAAAAHSSFLGLWKAPIGEFSASRAEILAGLDRELVQGFTGSHGFALLPGNDFTNVVAIAAGFGGAFLTVHALRQTTGGWLVVLVAATCFASMAASAEQTIPIAMMALFILTLGLTIQSDWSRAVRLILLAILSVALTLIHEGSLSAIVFGSEAGSRASFAFEPANIFTLPTDAMLYSARTSPFFSVPLGQARVYLFDPIVLKELPWVFLAVGLGAYFTTRRERLYIAPFVSMVITAFLIPGLFVDQVYPINIARFTSVGVYLAGLLAGIVAGELWLNHRKRQLIFRTMSIVLLILTVGSWTASIPLWPARLYHTANTSLSEDMELASYLRERGYGHRALVLPGPTTLAEVITDKWEGLHKFVVSFGATSIPLGLDAYSAGEWYGAHYRRAYDTFDPIALRALRIDTVIVGQHLIDVSQANMLSTAESKGHLILEFQSSNGARAVYSYIGSSSD
jgi:hypothetical protein